MSVLVEVPRLVTLVFMVCAGLLDRGGSALVAMTVRIKVTRDVSLMGVMRSRLRKTVTALPNE